MKVTRLTSGPFLVCLCLWKQASWTRLYSVSAFGDGQDNRIGARTEAVSWCIGNALACADCTNRSCCGAMAAVFDSRPGHVWRTVLTGVAFHPTRPLRFHWSVGSQGFWGGRRLPNPPRGSFYPVPPPPRPFPSLQFVSPAPARLAKVRTACLRLVIYYSSGE